MALGALLEIIGRRPEETCAILSQAPGGVGLAVDWTTVGQAEVVASGYAGSRNVWFGVQPIRMPQKGRGKRGDVTGVRTLYADLDYKNMAPAVALELVEDLNVVLGVNASAIVASGGGLQPYWPIEEIDPVNGAMVLLWWREQVIKAAGLRGVAVDTGVFDLSRILRVPGPRNLKACYGVGGARTGMVRIGCIPNGGSCTRLSGEMVAARIRMHPSGEPGHKATRVFTRSEPGMIGARAASGDDRVFTPAQWRAYLYENPGTLATLGRTEMGTGFNVALNKAAFDCAAGVPELWSEADAVEALVTEIEKIFPGGPDQQDWSTIRSGFSQTSWSARRPTSGELADPFSAHCDKVALWVAQGSQTAGTEPAEAPPTTDVVYAGTATELQHGVGVEGGNEVDGEAAYDGHRRLVVTRGSEITMRATDWLWEHGDERWIPLGGLVLLGGREGVGKSTWTARLVAQVTNGKMEGKYSGTPRGVIICAAEDDWATTIVPRLAAAGADLKRIFRVDAQQGETTAGLTLPTDINALEEVVVAQEVALIVLDPLLGTIAGKLDTHKDSDVRHALEPLTRLAHDSRATVLGLIHENKASSGDLITKLMGSRAFAAVARAVLVCAHEGERPPPPGPFNPYAKAEKAPQSYLFGQLKNNLGPRVETSVRYEIESAQVAWDPTKMKHIISSKIRIMDYSATTDIQEMVNEKAREQDGRKAVGGNQITKCQTWLREYLAEAPKLSSEVKVACLDEGFSLSTLKKAAAGMLMSYTGEGNNPLWSLGVVRPNNSG